MSLKKVIAVLLALTMTLFVGFALSACGDENPDDTAHTHEYESTWTADADGHYKKCICHPGGETKISHADLNTDGECDVCEYEVGIPEPENLFKVTVKDDEGNPVANAEVKLEEFAGTKYATTDASGVASFEVTNTMVVKASVNSLPEGYAKTKSEVYTFASGQKALTITDVEKLVLYTFLVTDEYGDGVEGVRAQICTGNDCRPGVTDVNGKISTYISKAAVERDGVKALITALPEGYANSEGMNVEFEYVYFEDGETELEAIIVSVAEYTVKAEDFYQMPLENVVVEVYDAMTNQMVATETTDESGVVSFALMLSDYYVKAEHLNSSFKWINNESNILSAKNTSYVANFVESTDAVLYTFYVTGPDGNPVEDGRMLVCDEDNNMHHPSIINNGSYSYAATFIQNKTFFVSAIDNKGNYAFVEIKRNGPTDVYITLNEEPFGSTPEAAVPAIIFDDDRYLWDEVYGKHGDAYTFEAGETMYFAIPDAHGWLFEIDGNKFDVEYNGAALVPDSDGRIKYVFNLSLGEDALLKVTAKEAATEDIAVSHPGSYNDPYYYDSYEINGASKRVNFIAGETKYFYMYSHKECTLIVDAPGTLISINGRGSRYVTSAYESILIEVTALEAGEIEVGFVYEEMNVDYTVNLVSTETQTLDGYDVSIYTYNGVEFLFIALVTTKDGGVAVFESLPEKNNYYVAITSDGYIKEYVKIENSDEATALVLAHERDGSETYPYYPEQDENTVSVEAGGAVWYTVHVVNGSYTMSVLDNNLALEIYVLVDGQKCLLTHGGEYKYADFGVDATAEGVYVFSSGNVYMLKFASVDGAADEFVFDYKSNAKTKENAITVSEEGEISITVKDGETDYYRLNFVGTVTLTLSGEASMSKITSTVLGEVTETVDGKTLTLTLTEESEVYIRLFSQNDGDYIVTITLE